MAFPADFEVADVPFDFNEWLREEVLWELLDDEQHPDFDLPLRGIGAGHAWPGWKPANPLYHQARVETPPASQRQLAWVAPPAPWLSLSGPPPKTKLKEQSK